MVKELLAKFNMFLCRENELFSKPLPGRDQEKEAEIYQKEMEETFYKLQELEKEYLQELVRLAADKAKEKELLRELTFLQELHRKQEENIALCREKLEFTGKELDRVQKEKKAHFAYYPGVKRREAGLVDNKI